MSEQIIGPVGENEEQELAFSSTEVISAMQQDMDFFAGVVLPEDCSLAFPPEYVWIWQQLTSIVSESAEKFFRLALGLPRGHGKTQVVKLFIVFCLLFTKKRYILIIGATLEKASAILQDVSDMMDSQNIQELFGNWRWDSDSDRIDMKVFTFQGRKVVLQAAGTGTSIRGTNRGNARPDLIIFDDAQTSKCAESLPEAKSFQSWFTGTAMKAKSNKGCTFIYIGNMYKDLEFVPNSGQYTCLLRMLQKSKAWVTFIVGAILSDGSALWEELYSLKDLLKEYESDKELGQEAIFYAEVLNNPTGGRSYYVDTEKFTIVNNPYEFPHQGNYIVIDPATSKLTPDQLTIQYYEIQDTRPICCEIIAEKMTGPDTVAKTIALAIRKQCSLIVVEDNAYQSSLCEWFRFICEQQNIRGLQIVGLTSTTNKNARILQQFKALMQDEMRLSASIKSLVEHQAASFDPTKTNNLDDILDNLTLASRAAINFRHLMHIPGDLNTGHLLVADYSQDSYNTIHTEF